MNPSEEPNFQAIAHVLESAAPIPIEMGVKEAYALVALLQLALRHPGTVGTPTGRIGHHIARALQGRLGNIDPMISASLEQGWNQELDAITSPLDSPN
jgi:hypothetical protein